MKEIMEKLPYMKELMDVYCGPDRVTAKQQQQELERVAKTLPENAASSVKRFTERALLSLQVVFIFISLYVSIWTMIFTRIKPFFLIEQAVNAYICFRCFSTLHFVSLSTI